MPTPEVRLLTAEDADAWFQLRLFALRDTPTAFLASYEEELEGGLEKVRERLNQGTEHFFIVGAFDGDELVGNVGCFRPPRIQARHKAGIWGVFVHPDARGRGIARALMGRAIETAQTVMGAELLQLGVNVGIPAACALYESLGFVTYGTERDGFRVGGKACDEYLMALQLGAKPSEV